MKYLSKTRTNKREVIIKSWSEIFNNTKPWEIFKPFLICILNFNLRIEVKNL